MGHGIKADCLHEGPEPKGGALSRALSKDSYPILKGVLEKTTENSERRSINVTRD